MKKQIFIILLSLIACHLHSYAYDTAQENTLLQKLNAAAPNDTIKLNILYQLTDISINEPERRLYYINSLLTEAEKQKNDIYKCKAYLFLIGISFNTYDVEAVNKWVALLVPLAHKTKQYDSMFRGKRVAIDILNIKGEYELAEKEASKMMKEAKELKNNLGIVYSYQSLGYAYAFTYRYEKATEAWEKAYAISSQNNFFGATGEICDRLISIYTILNNNEKRLEYIRNQEMTFKKAIQRNPLFESSYNNDLLLNYVHYLDYYLDTNDLTEAEKYIKLSEKLFLNVPSVYQAIYHKARFMYFWKKDNLTQALTEVDALIEVLKIPTENIIYKFNKALLLIKLGRQKEALALYKVIWPEKDSLQLAIINQQTEQLKKDYETDTLKLKKESINHTTQLSFIVLIVIISLILIWFMIHTYRIQSTLSKAEKEQRKLSNDMELANVAKERFMSNISSAINIPLNSVLENSLILASDEDINPKERKIISQTITATSNELMKLINNILDLSRLEAGMMKYNISEIEVISMVRDIINIAPSNTNAPKIVSQIPQGSLVWLSIDNNRLIQVIKTLIEKSQSVDNPITVNIETQKKERTITINVCNSFLSMVNPPQEIIIYNAINSMLIAHFEGTYEIHTDKKLISFTLPFINIQDI